MSSAINFSQYDYQRSQDAKVGLLDLYMPSALVTRPQSQLSTSMGRSSFEKRSAPTEIEKVNEAKAKLRAQQKLEDQTRLQQEKLAKRVEAAKILEAFMRSFLMRRCRSPGVLFEADLILFFFSSRFVRLAAICKSKLYRSKYEEEPYVSPDLLTFFPGLQRSR